MKKIFLTLAALFVLSLSFTSCGSFGMEVLEDSDVSSKWCSGYWSGSVKTDTNLNAQYLKQFDIQSSNDDFTIKLTPNYIKDIINLDGTSMNFIFVECEINTCVKSNIFRNKLYIEQEYKVNIEGEELYATTTMNLLKD